MSNIYVPAKGRIGAKIAFVGEAPAYEEEIALEPLVGPSGRMLRQLCIDAGINFENTWRTNVSKYAVPPNIGKKKLSFEKRAKEAGIDIDQQLAELRMELNEIKPNVLIALGGSALWGLTGKTSITNWRGSIMMSMNGMKVVPTFHPAHLLHQEEGYWARQVIIFDLRRAKEQSEFPEIRRPSRIIHICKNSAQLQEFIGDHEKEERMAEDIEAIHCIPVCTGIAFNKKEAMSVPLWNRTSFCEISTIPDSDLASVWLTLARLNMNPKFKKIGQNFKYDEDKITKLGLGIDRLHSDTMLKAFAINPELPKNLAFNTSIYTEQPYYKDEGADFDYRKHPIKDLLLYNGMDACVTHEIDTAQEIDLVEIGQQDFYYNFLMKLHKLYLDIENVGFLVDQKRREELLLKYIQWDERLRYELWKNTGQFVNAMSWKQVDKLLYDDLKVPRRKGTGEEVLTKLLNGAVKKQEQKDAIVNILDQRRVRKTIGTYILAPEDYDGRMRTTYYLCLETGRTSTGLQEPPIRPWIEVVERDEKGHKKKKKKARGTAFQTMTKHGDIGQDIREQYIADPGYVFLNADKSQAEARVVARLADDEEMLKLYDEHDIHALTASWFVGGTEEDWSKKKLGYEHPNRFLGKTLRHAGHLGAKKSRAATEVNTQARKYHIPIEISEAQAEIALKVFHMKSPKIQGVFHNGVIECINKSRILIAPLPYGIDSKFGGRRTFFERYGDELFRQAFSYLPQRAISDSTKADALRIKARLPWIRIILESHDALLFAVDERIVDDVTPIIREEMERPINFETCSLPRKELVVPCEIEIGYNYREFKKYKFPVETTSEVR